MGKELISEIGALFKGKDIIDIVIIISTNENAYLK